MTPDASALASLFPRLRAPDAVRAAAHSHSANGTSRTVPGALMKGVCSEVLGAVGGQTRYVQAVPWTVTSSGHMFCLNVVRSPLAGSREGESVAGRRRFGRVRRLPSGRWQARYVGPDGRERTAPDTFPAKTDAARFLSAVEVDIGRGAWLDPDRGSVPVRTYADAWLSARRVKGQPLAAATRSVYRRRIDEQIIPTFGNIPIDRVTPAAVRTWYAATTKIGATTAAQAYRLLHAIFATAVADGDLVRNPCQIKGAGQPSTPERPLVDRTQVEALAEAMPKHLMTLVLLAFWGGLRLGELLALEVGDLDLAANGGSGSVRVQRQQQDVDHQTLVSAPKVGSIRTVHLPAPAVAALVEHLVTRGPALPTARVFVRASGEQLHGWDVHRYWDRARREVGLPTVRVHDLRHAGLTLAAQSGATLAEVMRRAGHTTSRAALLYQHAAEDRDRDLAARMSAEPAGTTRSVRARSGHEPGERRSSATP